jgi:hypothetical protein
MKLLPPSLGLPTKEAAKESERRLRRLLVPVGKMLRHPAVALKILPLVLSMFAKVAAKVTGHVFVRFISDLRISYRSWRMYRRVSE